MIFLDKKIDLNLYVETTRIQNSISVASYDEKTDVNHRNCYAAEKYIVSNLSEILILNLIAQIEDLNEDYVKISRPYI